MKINDKKNTERLFTKELLWESDLGNGRYRNPILYGDFSDPDVIRVEDTYYMTASSFNYMPGLPILVSKDLVNWELVNYAVKRLPFRVYDKPAHAKGIWAPSIRYYKDKFRIYFGMPDEGIFMTCAKDPLKEWEPLVCVKEGLGLIDVCPFWEEDGRGYLVHAYANSRIGIKSKLALLELNEEGTGCIGEDRIIFDGTLTQPTIEGPKVYKREDRYYIFAPAGGVKWGWQTVLRSTSIYGPYEEKIVMHQGDTDINGPHQGGLVDTKTGEEWFLHFQQKGAYGRIVHLQPVKWEKGWPLIGIDGNGDGIGEPVYEYEKPEEVRGNNQEAVRGSNLEADLEENLAENSKEYIGGELVEKRGLEATDYFEKEELGLQWQWLANYSKEFYSLREEPGRLCLYPLNTTREKKALIWNSANVLTQKILCPEFTAITRMDFSKLSQGDRSGILIIGEQYGALYVERRREGDKICYLESEGEEYIRKEQVIAEYKEIEKSVVYLKVRFYQDESCEFSYCLEDGQLGSGSFSTPTRRFYPKGAIWVGAKVGLFAISDEEEARGKVLFDYFKVITE